MTDIDENGEFCGYTYEYLEEIAQYAGWSYEFVQVPGDAEESMSTLLKMLADGEINLMGSMVYTENLGELYDFSSQYYGTMETVLQVLTQDYGKITINSQTTQKLRVAVIDPEGELADELESYCRITLIEPEYIICADEEAQAAALRDGRADVMLNSSLNFVEGVYTIASFSPKPVYFIATKGSNSEMLQELDLALMSIKESDPNLSVDLFEKYFSDQSLGLTLPNEEKEYISGLGAVKVGFVEEQAPLQYMGEEGINGVSIDVLGCISQKTGLQFEMVPAKNSDQLYEMVDDGSIDLIAGISYDYALAREKNVSMTRPYMSNQYAMVASERTDPEERTGMRLALTTSSTYNGYTVGNVIRFDTMSECVQAVAEGEADYTYVGTAVAQYYSNQSRFWNLKVIPLSYAPYKVCFAMPNPADNELLEILNKTINSISVEEIQAIVTRNTLPNWNISLGNFIRLNPFQSILIISGVLLILISLLVFILLQRMKNSRLAADELDKRLRVYALANDYFFEYDRVGKRLTVSVLDEDGAGGLSVLRFDFLREPEKLKLDHVNKFINAILSTGDGPMEFKQLCSDGEEHWLRIVQGTIGREDSSCVIGKINIIDSEREEKTQLLEKAQLDGLTHVLNVETAKAEIAEAMISMREGCTGALLLIDIDRFKEINDTYGHLQGDAAICGIARILGANVRKNDIVGRYGGDEFIVYIRDVFGEEMLRKRCELLCNRVRENAENGFSLTVSMGGTITFYGDSFEAAFNRVDMAMYEAKNAGRDQYKLIIETKMA